MSIAPEWSLGARKSYIIEILYCTETANYVQFRAEHCQKYASNQKAPNKSCSELNFVQKSLRAQMSIAPEWSLGARESYIIEILYCTETANYVQFRTEHCQKYASNQKSSK